MRVHSVKPMDHVFLVLYTPPQNCFQKQYTLESEEDAPPMLKVKESTLVISDISDFIFNVKKKKKNLRV